VGEANKIKFKQLQDLEATLPEVDRMLAVRACKVKSSYDATKVRLVVAIRGEYDIQAGAEYKTGRAPTGGMERAI
jgi:hypothetical protein